VTTALRRDAATVLATHSLEPERCELFVEGPEDRRVLTWLSGSRMHAHAYVSEADAIDVPGVTTGGQRARLIAFSRLIEAEPKVRVFIDADIHLFEEGPGDLPTNVWYTDGLSLESYVLTEACVEKFLRLGLRDDRRDAASLLARVLELGRRLFLFRLVSYRQALDLPFQTTRLERHVTVSGSDISLDERRIAQAILQNAGRNQGGAEALLDAVEEAAAALGTLPNEHTVHGKDAFLLLGEVALECGASRNEVSRLLWTTLERGMAGDFPTLSQVLHFLETCDAEVTQAESAEGVVPLAIR